MHIHIRAYIYIYIQRHMRCQKDLKELKRSILKFDLKILKEEENFIKDGRLFQSLGAAMEKALSPLDFNLTAKKGRWQVW